MNSKLQVDSNTAYYKGKVRDVYTNDDKIFIVVSDRISAFDVILPRPIPYKGAVLNGISTFFLNETKSIVPNWLIDAPNSHCCYGILAPTIPIEVIIRGYLAGSMWRAYEKGIRNFCGNILPDGLKNNQKLPNPIITPTTKAMEGHDEDTSEEEIIISGVVSSSEWEQIKNYAFRLFEFGSNYASSRGLILVDTKLEFGRTKTNEIILIDEILTPDSSRYFIEESYQQHFERGENPEQLSKEFVRQWLIDNQFMGRESDILPLMTDDWVDQISERYINLYTKLLGKSFVKESNHFDISKIQQLYDQLSKS
jgi:phosphoribosylaminoimidazole-succinocarboxamide synthase